MRIEWDVPIEMDDGTVLRGDVYRPIEYGEYPVILSYGPYGKWLHFGTAYEGPWERLNEKYPDATAGSSNKYQSWEVVDPERWVPDGYAVVRVDSRGAGRSPGYLDLWSPRETKDYAECIEWAGARQWSNGKVGLNGISYYAMNQWQVATLQPDHLAAMCIWEGAADWYRDFVHHGGIYCTFSKAWYRKRLEAIQHGMGRKGYRSRITGDLVSGPETLTEEELGNNRADFGEQLLSNKLATAEYWTSRDPDWSKIEVPLLSSANWAHQLHTRGNFEGFRRAASEEKWLEVHGREHWAEFYTDYGVELQKKFFGHFLKGEDTGWTDQPRVLLNIRHPGGRFVQRAEEEWPISRTKWTRYYLHSGRNRLSTQKQRDSRSVTYKPFDDGVTFVTDPLGESTEITGPIATKLFISSQTTDADIFAVVRVFRPDLSEVVFQGAVDPHTPVAQGWLRASHRKLDPERTTDWRPYHTHDEIQALDPGEIYEVDIEVWPTCVVVPSGYRIALSIRGRDYEYPGASDTAGDSPLGRGFTGVGPFRHEDPRDRPPDIYNGEVTIYSGPEQPSHLLLPIVPGV